MNYFTRTRNGMLGSGIRRSVICVIITSSWPAKIIVSPIRKRPFASITSIVVPRSHVDFICHRKNYI
jgi:hypothetical protein